MTALVTDGNTSVRISPLTAKDTAHALEASRPHLTKPIPIVGEPTPNGVLVPGAIAGQFIFWLGDTGFIALGTRTAAATVLVQANDSFARVAAGGPAPGCERGRRDRRRGGRP